MLANTMAMPWLGEALWTVGPTVSVINSLGASEYPRNPRDLRNGLCSLAPEARAFYLEPGTKSKARNPVAEREKLPFEEIGNYYSIMGSYWVYWVILRLYWDNGE